MSEYQAIEQALYFVYGPLVWWAAVAIVAVGVLLSIWLVFDALVSYARARMLS